jgi:flagellar biosynthetic protein FliQ
MTPSEVLEIGRELLFTALLLALPALLASLVVGLVVSVLQTITSIQDQTLSFVPRIIAVGFALVVSLAWTLQLAVHFTVVMLWRAAEVTR